MCPCPPADVALMADIAGLDAEAWTARAVIAQHEGTEKGEALKAALKKAFAVTGAAAGFCGTCLVAINMVADRLYTMYIRLRLSNA